MSKKIKIAMAFTGLAAIGTIPMFLTSCNSSDSDSSSSSNSTPAPAPAPAPTPTPTPAPAPAPEQKPQQPSEPTPPQQPEVDNDQKKFDDAYKAFDIKSNGTNISSVLATSINSKESLKKYFTINEESDLTYDYHFNGNDDNGNLQVIVTIKLNGLSKSKEFNLHGFEIPKNVLAAEVQSFNLIEKGSHSNVLASIVNSEVELKKYYSFEKKSNFGYAFTFVDNDDNGTLDVTVNISYRTLTDSKQFHLSGFRQKTQQQENVIPDSVIGIETKGKDFDYVVKQDKTIEVTKAHYKKSEDGQYVETDAIIVPEQLEVITNDGSKYKLDVTSIKGGAFALVPGMQQVKLGILRLPNTITEIKANAFSGNVLLTGIEIPNKIQTIGNNAFFGCSGIIGRLDLPNTLTSLGENAFSGCSGITSVVIPQSLTTIPTGCFTGCVSLGGDLTIPNSITEIGGKAFWQCKRLTHLNFQGNSLTKIGDNAFAGCSNLEGDLTIPDSVVSIGASAFQGSYKKPLIGDIKQDAMLNEYISSLSPKPSTETEFKSALLEFLNSNSDLLADEFIPTSGVFEDKDVVIEGFKNTSNNVSIKKITVTGKSNKFTYNTIKYTLEETYSLTSNTQSVWAAKTPGKLKLGSGLTSIKVDAFKNCSLFIGDLVIPNTVTTIEKSVFEGCSNFVSLTLPTSIQMIDDQAFQGCEKIANHITIPSTVTTIGIKAFQKCSSLSGELTIPSSVTRIKKHAFEGCSSLTSLTVEDSTTVSNRVIEDNVFNGCLGLTGDVIIPKSFSEIQSKVFTGCDNLNSIKAPANAVPKVLSWTPKNMKEDKTQSTDGWVVYVKQQKN